MRKTPVLILSAYDLHRIGLLLVDYLSIAKDSDEKTQRSREKLVGRIGNFVGDTDHESTFLLLEVPKEATVESKDV